MLGSLQTGIQPPIREISSPPEAAPLSDATLDELLIADLRSLQGEQQISSAETGDTYANASVANHICPQYSSRQINRLESHLAEHGTFDIPIVYGNVIVDGITRTIPFVAATETNANHGEMSSMLYLRDHIQVARGFMELYQQDPSRYQAEGDMGRELLRSALLLMSTDSQLTRFEQVIEMGREAGQADWPQISLHFNDLDGNEPNGWRNKQDTLQMLGHLTFDAIDRRFIDVDELTERDKEFLGFLTPFLASVGFPLYENSGSWEEFAAVRTSVMAVETALLHKQLLLL
ncbi:MAG: hypothetical protein JWP13_684, partial [Candidatus Saccharibacteria bacterium]|nr:hypothetical protein [Candidatus Saccharibacteria bacterium]